MLELGCSDGGNVISMASTLPDAEFVGIDLAPRQIAMAEETRTVVGLQNLTFHAMSFTDLGEKFGKFDYIIAHCLFSWVPLVLQDELLTACSRLLTPAGLAHLSFNVYPGARALLWLREKLLYHLRDIEGARERPMTSTLVRFRAPTRHQIPTLHHSNVSIDDPAACTILAVLDGTRDRDALAAVLHAAVRDEKIGINVGEVPLQDVEDPESVARQIVEDKLQKALDLGLLISAEAA